MKTVEKELAAFQVLYESNLISNVSFYIQEDGVSSRPVYEGTDFVRYFGEIPNDIIYPYSTIEYAEEESKQFQNDLRLLQEYAQGELDDYPYESVKNRLNSFGGAISMEESEGFEYLLIAETQFTFIRYAELALKWCDNLEGLATFVSKDGKAGVMEITGGSHTPWFSLMFLQSDRDPGYHFSYSIFCSPSKVLKLPVSTDDVSYYLFYSDPNAVEKYYGYRGRWVESLALFSVGDGIFKSTCFNEDDRMLIWEWINGNPDQESQYIIFSPEKCRWNFCTYDGKYYHVVPGTSSLCFDPSHSTVFISRE